MVGAILAAISVGAGLYEGLEADKAGRRKSKSILDAAERQAKAYESEAASTLQTGAYEAGITRLKGAETLGEARVAQAASRLDGGEDTLRKSLLMTETDVAMIKMNARRAAWGLTAQARETRLAGEEAAAAARQEGRARAVRSIIGGASQGASYYGKYA